MRWRIVVLVVLVLGLVLLVWSPWLTRAGVETRIRGAFQAAWGGVVDGCGFNCEGCGVVRVERLAAGYRATIEYACGLLPEDSPAYHVTDRVYVSPLGTVHGLPAP
jgi:hypothetical protein